MEKPHWMTDHEQSDQSKFAALSGDIKEIKDMLLPVVKTYETVARLGAWSKIALGFILLGLSVAVAAKTLFK